MDRVSREMEVLRRNQREVLEIKGIAAEMKNVSNELISRLDWLRKESVNLKICQ